MLKTALAQITAGQPVAPETLAAAFAEMVSGTTEPLQIAGLLAALATRGETAADLATAAAVLRAHATPLPAPPAGPIFDTAGTGGDGAHTFNLSTAAACILAGTGRRVAKHGNRAASSRCGSADVFAALGVPPTLTPAQAAATLAAVGFSFCFAPTFQPALRHLAPIRQALGVRTIFNLLGPLLNPARPTVQLLGCGQPQFLRPLAEALATQKVTAAWVVCGAENVDELTLAGPAQIVELRAGQLHEFTLDPAEYGLARAPLAALRGGDAAENAAILRGILAGEITDARADAAVLNAAGAIAAQTGDFAAGLAEARASLTTGAAEKKLQELVDFTQQFK